MRSRIALLTSVLFCALPLAASAQWIKQNVNTTASFRGLSVVNEKVVWASGTGGTVIRTIDGGKKWNVMTVAGAEKLDFRDIEAFDANTAYILSIGNGESSRIYKTVDGGKNWNLQFKNTNEKAFFDAIACRGPDSCFALSDPVNGKFLLLGPPRPTLSRVKPTSQVAFEDYDGPATANGEAAFAASGTCLVVQGFYKTFIVSGGTNARVFQRIADGSWKLSETGFVSGTSGTGIFSLAMFDLKKGVIVGGNYEKPDQHEKNLAFTNDGGLTWTLGSGLTGYRSGVTYVDKNTIIAVGTNGSDISRDGGSTWLRIDGENYNAVAARGIKSIWAVGPKGYIAKLDWHEFLAINGYKPCPKRMICDGPWVINLRLSHNEISTNCLQTNSECSNKRNIDISTSANDVPSNWYDYTVSGGQILGYGSSVRWDLSDVKPGTYTITVGLKVPLADSFQVLGSTITKTVVIR